MTARAIEKTYEVTKNAYIAVGNFENNVDGSKEELKNIKNVAIQDYLENQMSISTLRNTISGSLNIFIKYLFSIRLYIRCYIIYYSVV